MKAAFVRKTGAPDMIEYGDLPQPEPGPTQVLIKVGAAAVNPIDTYIRQGIVSMITHFPYVLGCDIAGVVERCGSEVTRFRVGDQVWGSNQGLFGRQGTFSEYAAVDEKWLYNTPEGESDADAAAGALVGLTAHLGLFLHGDLKPGEVVFVNGGSGGVGSAVIQLAHAAGATVIATAGTDAGLQSCCDLGADLAINYNDPNIDDQIRAFAMPHGGLQMWFETQREPTFDRTVSLIAPRGRIILMAGRGPPRVSGRSVLRERSASHRLRHVQRIAGRTADIGGSIERTIPASPVEAADRGHVPAVGGCRGSPSTGRQLPAQGRDAARQDRGGSGLTVSSVLAA